MALKCFAAAVIAAYAALGFGVAQSAEGAATGSAPPVISIFSPSDGSRFTGSEAKIIYEVTAPAGAAIDRIEVLVDGQRVVPRGVGRPEEKPGGANGGEKPVALPGSTAGEIFVPLPNRNAIVSLIAHAGGVASEPVAVRLVWGGPGIDAIKPKLYAVVVGVGAYADKSLTLKYPAKDAADFAAALQAQAGRLYAEVQVTLITDANATRNAIIKGLGWLKKQVTGNDVGVVYIAGHGRTDELGNFFFIPVNATAEEIGDQVAKYDILMPMRGLTGRALLFIDACHAAATSSYGLSRHGFSAALRV